MEEWSREMREKEDRIRGREGDMNGESQSKRKKGRKMYKLCICLQTEGKHAFTKWLS